MVSSKTLESPIFADQHPLSYQPELSPAYNATPPMILNESSNFIHLINMDIAATDITQKNTRYGCHVGMTLDFKAPKVGICNFDVNDQNGTSSNCGFDASIASSFGQKSTERLSTEMEETYRVYR